MPELPEVETARRSLEPLVVGRRISGFDVPRPAALRSHSPAAATKILKGRRIERLERRGKALLFHLDRGWTLAFHYALWGVVLVKTEVVPDAATAALIHLDDGRVIEFRELQFSNLNLYPQAAVSRVRYLSGLGPDPLDRSMTFARFRQALAGKGALRSLLTDQARLSGIGNLWALEILYAAGLRPARKAETLTNEMWRRLYRATRTVLRRGIRAGGEPESLDANGRAGRFRLAVYGRAGQPCPRCGTKIASGRVGGRPAFYCPKDQC
jgi:formamidopyrimidine-DNA glycosylase